MADETLISRVDAIMEQAQIFASTYSLVGGRFDDGSRMQQSEEEKAELRWMIEQTITAVRREPKIDPRHFNILAEAMAEVKAISDGLSDQPIADIVAGCLKEIGALDAAHVHHTRPA